MTDTPGGKPLDEDLTMVLVVHGLYIGSLLGFAPAAIVGVIMALVAQESAGPIARSHYRFQIRTFWIGLLAWALAATAMFWGAVFSVVLIGIPLLIVSGLAAGAIWLWALVRSILGLAWGVQGRRCPRPDSLMA